MAKVFISSTGVDLADYRQAAIDVCNRRQLIPVAMEHFEAMGAGANEGSVRKLDECDVYVGIYAHRYGYIEPGSPASVTEVEFDHAAERGLERLCFMLDPNVAWPPKFVDFAGHQQLEAFKQKVNTLVRGLFSSVDNFRERLNDALIEWSRRREARHVAIREIFEPLLQEYSFFVGREDALGRLRNFMQAPAPGYLVVTAPAGFGKTALMAQLVSADRDAFAYHFFSSVYSATGGEDLLSERFFLRNTVQQMSAWHGRGDRPPESLNELRGEYQKLLVEPLAVPRVLLLDGLDEVQDWRLRPYLNRKLPSMMHVIVTVRDSGQDWGLEYGLPRDQMQHLPLGGLTRAEIRRVLQVAGGPGPALARDEKILDRVTDLAAYPQDPTLGADPLYIRFLAEDIAAGDITAANMPEQPKNLVAYLDAWFGRIRASLKGSSIAADLFQTLAAALGPVSRRDLETMQPALKDPFNGFDVVLPLLRHAVAGNDQSGYALAHPRLRSYMEKYNLAPYRTKLLEHCSQWRDNQCPYALGYLVPHLQEAGRITEIYTAVLDRDFQEKQHILLGNIQTTLSDLKLAIELAAREDDLVHMLACVAEYRRLVQTEGVARGIFQAANEGRFDKALELIATCEGGQRSGRWLNTLFCYLIWEAAEANNLAAVRKFVAAGGRRLRQAGSFAEDLHRALLTRAAGVLAAHTHTDEATWLAELGVPEGYSLAVAPDDPAVILSQLGARIQDMERHIGESRVSSEEYIDEERAGDYTARLRDQLTAVAALMQGQDYTDRALRLAIDNPYPRYRDTALVALGIAVLAVPDPKWIRVRLQRILRAGLDNEGVTFTFDVPSQLAAEATRRGLPAPALESYLHQALASTDRWGTLLRARSARASALYWQNQATAALAELEQAASCDSGFAGFMSHHLLCIASRLCEFGYPEQVRARGLILQSRSHASRVRDPVFRQERISLVDEYTKWFDQSVPDAEQVDDVLANISDAENRRAYKDLVSARWSQTPDTRWRDLKRLVPLALTDGTVLDTLLGRVLGTYIRHHLAGTTPLPDAELLELIRICGENFIISRPWTHAEPAVA